MKKHIQKLLKAGQLVVLLDGLHSHIYNTFLSKTWNERTIGYVIGNSKGTFHCILTVVSGHSKFWVKSKAK